MVARPRLPALVSAAIVLIGSLRAAAQSYYPASQPVTPDTETEINKTLSNPTSSVWALQIQQNTYFFHPGSAGRGASLGQGVQRIQ
jgi:hypothetical protein